VVMALHGREAMTESCRQRRKFWTTLRRRPSTAADRSATIKHGRGHVGLHDGDPRGEMRMTRNGQ
jgi:hypothetical protein